MPIVPATPYPSGPKFTDLDRRTWELERALNLLDLLPVEVHPLWERHQRADIESFPATHSVVYWVEGYDYTARPPAILRLQVVPGGDTLITWGSGLVQIKIDARMPNQEAKRRAQAIQSMLETSTWS